jgi:predicted ATPase
MGTVHAAEVTESVASLEAGRKVAIKIIHPHLLSTPAFFKRFLREAELGRRVDHQNVVHTFDAGAVERDGQAIHYLAMEYVRGQSLRQLLRDLGTIPESLLREIALQIASGLDAIHAQGIVHRDLKPENVLITDDHEIRIMDLGVAKLQEASIAITSEGEFAGSLLYAAPEQFGPEAVTPRSDLYSFGVLLHELATGSNPFRHDDAAAVIEAHLRLQPPRVAEVVPETTTFFGELVAALLAKRPADRFASAGAVLAVLEEGERSPWWQQLEPRLRDVWAHLPKIGVRRETELFGRDAELKTLHEAWERAKATEGNTVVLEGEAGIGKTRLLDAFMRGLDDRDIHVLYGSYPPAGGLGGISDAILDKFGETNLADALAPYLTVTPSLVPGLVALVRHENPPDGSEPLQGDALHAVCVHLMRALAEEKPCIWLIEDLHFAPRESRDTVLALARAVEGHRVLLVATARPGVPGDELANFSRLENQERVTLGRLGADDVRGILQGAFRSDVLAQELGPRIALHSDGIPFFVFEMIRSLKKGRFIEKLPDGSYVQKRAIDEIVVPSAVRDLVAARLRDLTPTERAVVDVGAVHGFEFEPRLVADVLARKHIEVLQTLAHVERRTGVVSGRAGGSRFDHHQIHEVVYQDLTPDLRAEYHTLLAEVFARRIDGEPSGAEARFLATHHLHGRRPRDAVPHLVPALQFLAQSSRNEEAISLATRALDMPGLLEGAERVEVLLRKAGRHGLRWERAIERAAMDEALALADAEADLELRARVRLALAWHLIETWALPDAQVQLKQALALARETGARQLVGQATGRLGNVLHRLGRYDEARALFEKYLAIAREVGDRRGEEAATGNLGNVFTKLGRFDRARAQFEKALVLARGISHQVGENISIGALGVLASHLARYAEARAYFMEGLALAREIGNRKSEAILTGNLGDLCTRLGRYDEARERCTKALALAREIGERWVEGYELESLAAVAEGEGDYDEAARRLAESLAVRRDVGEKGTVAESLVGLARIDAARGETERAGARIEEALALVDETGAHSTILSATLVRMRLPGADVDAALAALAEHEEHSNYPTRMQARYRLWELTRDQSHLEEAHRLLVHLREHAPAEDRDSMIENVPLHRDIMRAWEEHRPGGA